MAVKVEGSRMVVRKDGQFFSVEDRPRASNKREEVAKVKVKRIQQVKTMLGGSLRGVEFAIPSPALP